MYLKRLELQGFKSFADRTRLEFGPGITAIVGPNGSGKSNIVDAIRWVLGEQNPRLLRGSRMEDVIFNGTQQRRAMGMAEVSLTLDNSDAYLPTEFLEVTIRRRVDRSGGSEYFINQSSCRLRDIQELFYDTGIGREAYSVVAQGRVDEILNARSHERRSLLEEAAGIVRYKVRKQEALRRLAQVEERLIRLGDIMHELRAQLAPLKAAAEKAKQHRILSDELRSLEIKLLQSKLQDALRRWERCQRSVMELRGELTTTQQLISDHESALIQLRLQLKVSEERLESARQEVERWREEVSRLTAAQQISAERVKNYEERLQQLTALQARLQDQLDGQALEDSGDRKRLENLRTRHAAISKEHQAVLQQLQRLTETVQRMDAALVQAREVAFSAMNDAAKVRNEQTRCEVELDALHTRRGQLESHRQELVKRAQQAEDQAARIREKTTSASRQVETLTSKLQQLDGERQALENKIRDGQNTLHRLQEELSRQRARLHSLESLQRSYEGYFSGVKTVLRGRDRGDTAFGDVIGVVAELVQTASQYQPAIEAALGGGIQNLITYTGDGAQRVIERLREVRGGRVTCLPLDGLRPATRDPSDERLLTVPGVIGWADSLVDYDPKIEVAVKYLLGRVLVAHDLQSARRAARIAGYKLRIVTLEGDIVHAGGAISGGASVSQRSGLLARRHELELVRQEVKRLEAQCGQLNELISQLNQQLAHVNGNRSACMGDLDRLRSQLSVLERDGASHLEAAARYKRELSTLDTELAQVAAKEKSLQRAVANHRLAADQLVARSEAARREAQKLESELSGIKQEESRLQQAAAAAEASLKAISEQLQAEEELEARALRQRQLLQEQLHQARMEQESLQAALEKERSERARLEQLRVEANAQRQKAEQQLETFSEQRNDIANRAQAAEQELNSLHQAAGKYRDRLHRAEIEEAKARIEADELRRRLQHDFGITITTQASQGDGEAEGDVRSVIDDLRRRLAAIGPVNPAAEEEYAAVSRRYEFLQQQTTDLVSAQKDLRELLEQMDEKLDEQFTGTFERLRLCFQQVFRRLFGGGRADLVLEEENGDGIAGVEILAQPPGKRMQPLSLLSGGERSLTAIALLFSLLEIKPTPFCIVDEVDAALDDTNLHRFCQYLQELSGRMQFIMITHKKASMAIADTLYGITPGDNGTSRLVAVRLSEAAAGVEVS